LQCSCIRYSVLSWEMAPKIWRVLVCLHRQLSSVTWLIRTWHDSLIFDLTHSYVRRLDCTWHACLRRQWPFVTRLIHMWHDSFTCDMTHSHVTRLIHMWHDSFICDLTHSYVTRLIHMWHDSFMCDMTHSYATWLIHVSHDSFICDMTHSRVTLCYQPRWPHSRALSLVHSSRALSSQEFVRGKAMCCSVL